MAMAAWTLAVLLVALQAPDILTTNAILARGGRELNPLMRLCMRLGAAWGLPWWLPKITVASAGAWTLAAWGGNEGLVSLILLVTAYLGVVGSNLLQLRRQTRRARRDIGAGGG